MSVVNADLLDSVPQLPRDRLLDAPEELLRGVLDAFRLEVRYDPAERTADCRIVVSDDALPTIQGSLTALAPVVPIEHARSGGDAHGPTARRNGSTVALVVGAPGRIRTCDARFRKPMLYPLSYEGLSCILPG